MAGRARWCMAVVIAVTASVGTAPAAAGGGWYDWPGMKKCDEFRAGSLQIKAYASKDTKSQDELSCRKANRIMRTWWKGSQSEVRDRFPAWRCTSGSGGGSCKNGERIAGYQNK